MTPDGAVMRNARIAWGVSDSRSYLFFFFLDAHQFSVQNDCEGTTSYVCLTGE